MSRRCTGIHSRPGLWSADHQRGLRCSPCWSTGFRSLIILFTQEFDCHRVTRSRRTTGLRTGTSDSNVGRNGSITVLKLAVVFMWRSSIRDNCLIQSQPATAKLLIHAGLTPEQRGCSPSAREIQWDLRPTGIAGTRFLFVAHTPVKANLIRLERRMSLQSEAQQKKQQIINRVLLATIT
jgi:hypothetical protein